MTKQNCTGGGWNWCPPHEEEVKPVETQTLAFGPLAFLIAGELLTGRPSETPQPADISPLAMALAGRAPDGGREILKEMSDGARRHYDALVREYGLGKFSPLCKQPQRTKE